MAHRPYREASASVGVWPKRNGLLASVLSVGASNKEIAGALQLSVATVSNHLQSIYRKFSVHGRVELMRRLSG